jgi:hypothetical protein
MNECPCCGQVLPMEAWLRMNKRTLWTTAELVQRYGGSAAGIGRELKRLGVAMRSIRHRECGGLTKKRALYCVKQDRVAEFERATPGQLRSWLLRERMYRAIGEIYEDRDIPPIVKDRLAHAAASMTR